MTTAIAATTADSFDVAQLRALPAAKAQALYDLAASVGVPICYQVAAHALAGALAETLHALTLREIELEAVREHVATLQANPPAALPSAPISPATLQDDQPAPEPGAEACEAISPTTAPKPARQSAPRVAKAPKPTGPDLSAPLATPPRAKRAAGAFHVVWDDGSCTTVTAVTYHADKPATRWAAALQAADRLRRMRGRNAYAASFGPGHVVHGRWIKGAAGVFQESATWWELMAARPMPALLAVVDDQTGEAFDAPAGSRFGAGDQVRALQLEAQVVRPISLERAPTGRTFLQITSSIIGDLDQVEPAPALETADPGQAVACADLHALDGELVVIPKAHLAMTVADWRTGRAEADETAIDYAVSLLAVAESEGMLVYTFRRTVGGRNFQLIRSDGRVRLYPAGAAQYLAHALPANVIRLAA